MTIVVFALVRIIAGTTAGMFSALLIAFNPAIIQRGNLGWFKSEPFGLFFGLLAIYLLLSAIKHNEIKYADPNGSGRWFFTRVSKLHMGGIQYLSIPIALFWIALPSLKEIHKFLCLLELSLQYLL